MTFAVAAET